MALLSDIMNKYSEMVLLAEILSEVEFHVKK